MIHVDTTLIVGIFIKTCCIWEQSTVSHPKNLSIFTSQQLQLSLNVLIWSICLSTMETTRWYLSNDMLFVLVYCCVGMLMTSCFGGSTSIVGRKRITLLQPKYTNFSAKYMNSRSKLHWNISVVLGLVSVTWKKRRGIGIPELHDLAERHSAFSSSSKWILLLFDFNDIFGVFFPLMWCMQVYWYYISTKLALITK